MKTLLILADGMRPDAMAACGSPVPEELRKHSLHTDKATTVSPPVTLPCHMSLFHSVEPGRHGILSNTYVPLARPVEGLCEALKRGGQQSHLFYTWEELRDLTRPGSVARVVFSDGESLGYREATKVIFPQALRSLKEDRPDFCFLYLGLVDNVGHHFGWMGKEYLEAVKESLKLAKEAIEAAGEEYVAILTADHGGHERNHGADVPEDMTIPLFVYHASFEEKKLEEASIMDIAPTITKILGVQSPAEWVGKSLL